MPSITRAEILCSRSGGTAENCIGYVRHNAGAFVSLRHESTRQTPGRLRELLVEFHGSMSSDLQSHDPDIQMTVSRLCLAQDDAKEVSCIGVNGMISVRRNQIRGITVGGIAESRPSGHRLDLKVRQYPRLRDCPCLLHHHAVVCALPSPIVPVTHYQLLPGSFRQSHRAHFRTITSFHHVR
jgi:hypothetical protein